MRIWLALVCVLIAWPTSAQVVDRGESIQIINREFFVGQIPIWTGAGTDLYCDPGDSCQMRKAVLSDLGNPSQLFFRRAGPDNADPYTQFPPTRLPLGTNIGHISWSAYEGTDTGWGERSAMLYVRYQGPGRGSMSLQTSGIDRVIVGANGELEINTPLGADERGLFIPITVNGQARRLRIE